MQERSLTEKVPCKVEKKSHLQCFKELYIDNESVNSQWVQAQHTGCTQAVLPRKIAKSASSERDQEIQCSPAILSQTYSYYRIIL